MLEDAHVLLSLLRVTFVSFALTFANTHKHTHTDTKWNGNDSVLSSCIMWGVMEKIFSLDFFFRHDSLDLSQMDGRINETDHDKHIGLWLLTIL